MKLSTGKIYHPSKSLTSYEIHIYANGQIMFYYYWPNGQQFTAYSNLEAAFEQLEREGGEMLRDKMRSRINNSIDVMASTIQAIKTVLQE